jgi:metallo-beta-lactamase family protein
MMEAGRIKHHLANNISNPQNTILVVGYCSPTTLGARIMRGDKEVSIFGTPYRVNAEVMIIDAFSGHGDYNEMMEFLECQKKDKIRETFLVHGEYETQVNYAAKLQQAGFVNIRIPSPKQEFVI